MRWRLRATAAVASSSSLALCYTCASVALLPREGASLTSVSGCVQDLAPKATSSLLSQLFQSCLSNLRVVPLLPWPWVFGEATLEAGLGVWGGPLSLVSAVAFSCWKDHAKSWTPKTELVTLLLCSGFCDIFLKFHSISDSCSVTKLSPQPKYVYLKILPGTSPAVQWLRLRTSNAGGTGLVSGSSVFSLCECSRTYRHISFGY